MPNDLSIFISYAHAQSAFVDKLEAEIKLYSFPVWVDRSKLHGGQEWIEKIENAINECDVVIVILSPQSVKSKYVKMEYRYAWNKGKKVIPLLSEACEIPMDLNSFHRIDFRSSFDQGMKELLNTLHHIVTINYDINTPSQSAQSLPPQIKNDPWYVSANQNGSWSSPVEQNGLNQYSAWDSPFQKQNSWGGSLGQINSDQSSFLGDFPPLSEPWQVSAEQNGVDPSSLGYSPSQMQQAFSPHAVADNKSQDIYIRLENFRKVLHYITAFMEFMAGSCLLCFFACIVLACLGQFPDLGAWVLTITGIFVFGGLGTLGAFLEEKLQSIIENFGKILNIIGGAVGSLGLITLIVCIVLALRGQSPLLWVWLLSIGAVIGGGGIMELTESS